MTKCKGSKKPTGGKVGNHSIARKRAMIQPALDASSLKRKETALAGREEQFKREKESFEKQRVTTAALEKRQIELDERDRLLKEKGSAAEKTPKPAEVARMKSAAATVERLVPRQGKLLTIAESRTILMLYFGLAKDGSSPNQAAMSTLLAMLRFNDEIIFFFVVKSTLEGATTNIIPSAIWFGKNIDCLCLGRCALTVLYREVSFFFRTFGPLNNSAPVKHKTHFCEYLCFQDRMALADRLHHNLWRASWN